MARTEELAAAGIFGCLSVQNPRQRIVKYSFRKPDEQTREILFMTFLMTRRANFSGHVHGGTILKLLDQVAYACAARYCKNYVVTASLDQVLFKQPIKVGELVTFKANVNYVGRTSI